MIVFTPILLVAAQAVFAPPAPPPIKSGQFHCDVQDRGGRRSALTGRLANWRINQYKERIADLSIDGALGSGLTLTTTVVMKPLQVDFHAYNAGTKATVSGTMDIGYGKEGKIMLDRRVLDGAGTLTQYVGFCDMRFSTEAEDRR